MSEDHVWDPDSYMDVVAAEIPDYGELQDRTAEACAGLDARTLLELGVGTAETARRVRLLYPNARLTAVDSSAEMLEAARGAIPAAELRLARLEDPLPEGPFDLVYSALAVHHLDAAAKRDLFRRVFDVLGPGGAFVLADLVVAADPADQRIAVDWEMDVPDLLADQLEWLGQAGFDAAVFWEDRDLAIVRAFRR